MRVSRLDMKDLVKNLIEQNTNVTPEELCNNYGISLGSYYRWKEFVECLKVEEIKKIFKLE